ncbi:hypothetical protein ASD52_14260 [Ensifer sp. Root142]|uniref:hypothetical protein n=1 Tax=Ensifer sp. Root142 TaxID=1736461 RepID=UPI0007091BD9|nr:hypothetical protein ASD52_14260 [Ensifer sp. Root142]
MAIPDSHVITIRGDSYRKAPQWTPAEASNAWQGLIARFKQKNLRMMQRLVRTWRMELAAARWRLDKEPAPYRLLWSLGFEQAV